MNRFWSLLGVLGISSALAGLAACASPETNATSAGGGEGGDPTGGSGGQGGGGQGGGGAGGQGGGGQGGSGGAGGAGGAGGQGGAGGGGALVPSLMTSEMYIDCMPIVDADPIIGTFTATYDNSAGANSAEAVIASSRLVFSDGKAWSFKVAPGSSGTVGPMMSSTAAHQKQNGSGSGTVAPCSYCGQMWTLEVTWTVGGSVVMGSLGPTPVECVY